MITADTITTAQVQAIFHALAATTDKARLIMRRAQDGKISPVVASEAINDLLANLYAKLGEAEEP